MERRITGNSRILAVICICLMFCVATVIGGELTEKFDKTLPLPQGGKFELRNSNGAIHVQTWDRDEVRIEAEKRVRVGGHSEAERLLKKIEIRIDAGNDYVKVATEMPRTHGGGFWDLIFDGGSPQLEVTYWITLPKRVEARLSNTNGKVEVGDITGSCDVSTTNGRIVMAEMAGSMRAETTNGSIELRLVGLNGNPDVDLETTNGGITAELPANFSGWVSAETTNGSVQSDFPVTVERGFSKNRLEGKVGEGASRLRAETTNGSIRLIKR